MPKSTVLNRFVLSCFTGPKPVTAEGFVVDVEIINRHITISNYLADISSGSALWIQNIFLSPFCPRLFHLGVLFELVVG